MKMLSKRLDALAGRLRAQAMDLRFDNFLSFVYTSEVVNQYLDTQLRKSSLNRTQMSILHILITHGGVMTPTELSCRVQRSKHATTRSVDNLDELGLTKSSRTKKDRRLRKVAVTEKGLDMVESTMPLRHDIASRVMQCLTDDEMEVINSILRKLRKHVLTLWEDITDID